MNIKPMENKLWEYIICRCGLKFKDFDKFEKHYIKYHLKIRNNFKKVQ